MAVYDFAVVKGRTFNGLQFQVFDYVAVATLVDLPVTGTTGIVYVALDTGIYYKWNGSAYIVTTDTHPLVLTLSAIEMQIRTSVSGPVVADLTISKGITLVDGPNGIFSVDEQVFDIPEGVYVYDVLFTISGAIRSYISGSITVTEGITR